MILPAIDLIKGKAVRLTQGDFNQEKIYPKTPVELAKDYEAQGYTFLHLVDLEGSKKGTPLNLQTLHAIKSETNLKVQYGGGLQSVAAIKMAFEMGADRVLISKFSFQKPEQMKKLMELFGPERFAFCWDGKIVDDKFVLFQNGWTEEIDLSFEALVEQYKESLPGIVFVTDIQRDGMLKGSNVELYKQLKTDFPFLPIGASGGVSNSEELYELKDYCDNVIIGKALLEGKIEPPQEFLC